MAEMLDAAKAMGFNMDIFGDGIPFGDPSWYQGQNSPYYNDSHKRLRKFIRPILEEKVFPHIHDWDEAKEIPSEIFVELGSRGYNLLACGRPYPIEYCQPPEPLKGLKIDTFHELIGIDELSRSGSGGLTWGLCGGLLIGLPPVNKYGTKELKDRVLPKVLSGHNKICLCITEPSGGSDVAGLRTTAVKDADGNYIVNGEKKWITNGIYADFFTVAVRTGGKDRPGHKGLSFILIERNMPGVETRRMNCSGVWSSGTSFVTFDDVKVPASNLLGKENKGFKMMMQNFNHERFALCVQTCRFARVCLEESIKFAKKRKTFGRKLVDHAVIRWKIAEMARQVEASQSWLESIAYNMETMNKNEADLKLGGMTALCKVQCTKTFEYCAREGAQIFGGLSYSRGGQGEKVERLNREVRAMAVPGGSEEIMLDLGVRQMMKLAEFSQHLLSLETDKAKL